MGVKDLGVRDVGLSEFSLAPDCTLDEATLRIASLFTTAGIEDARRAARLLVLAALDLSMAVLITQGTCPLGEAAPRLAGMARRRASREPLSRILGTRWFYGQMFRLNAATLDPRPETEHLVEGVLHALTPEKRAAPLRLLDLGTGSGIILITLVLHLPEATGLGVDIAPDAVEMACENAGRLGLGARATFRINDLFAGIDERFDIIVSNPPYIPSACLPGLMPEVQNHDPALALDGGADGLDFYRRIIAGAKDHLKPGGLIALELGIGQSEAVKALLQTAGFVQTRVLPDLAGIPRVLLAGGCHERTA